MGCPEHADNENLPWETTDFFPHHWLVIAHDQITVIPKTLNWLSLLNIEAKI